MDVRKVLVIGSGPIKIAEAAEFDYSGIQALKAYKEEGLTTVLVNPNVATVQTTRVFADRVYLVPIKPEFLEMVIERERPDAIACGFGGQTALSACINLNDLGILSKYGIKVLGTPIEGIRSALSRQLFKDLMNKHGIPVLPSKTTYSLNEALSAARELGYPVLARVSFNLGGAGAFVAHNDDELISKYHKALAMSEIKEVLIEKYIGGWKEIEFEVMRDKYGESVAVVCMENIDPPMGVHTGDSVVVAPCLTLTNDEYQRARLISIGVANAINLIGECNVQVAINPRGGPEMYVIETNPRMSRSSALASKASGGYPLAYIAAKLTLGYRLSELINRVTGKTVASFEPSLDYVVVKIPRWESDRFGIDESLGPEMMSIGEVMGIGRTLEEAWQKAVRMLDIGEPGLVGGRIYHEASIEEAMKMVKERKPYWFLYAAVLLREGFSVDDINEWTGVDKFFLYAIKRVVDFYEGLRRGEPLPLEEAYVLGFSEEQLRRALGNDPLRRLPVVKQIDTLAGEWPAATNYLYLTHGGEVDDYTGPGVDAVVTGAGVFRIGVSVEFDWSVVNTVLMLKRLGYRIGVLNYNPETVSTDWDFADKLFFDQLTPETLRNILIKERPKFVVLWAGGQIGQRLYGKARSWLIENVRILGTRPESVDLAEDRSKFSKLLDELGLDQPPWAYASTIEELIGLVERWLDYPVIVRPSYVLGGTYMGIARNRQELLNYVNKATRISPEHPVVVSKFIGNGVEVEVDGVGDGNSVIVVPVEHIEPPGVHSGDSTMVIPPRGIDYRLNDGWRIKMAEASLRIAKALGIVGPFNIQFIAGDKLYVIEANVRASRSMPFTSKATGVNLMNLSVKAALNGLGMDREFMVLRPRRWWVKASQFSWSRVRGGSYPRLGPVMYSTGEVASSGKAFEEALLKAWLSTTPSRIPRKNALVYTYDEQYIKAIDEIRNRLSKWLVILDDTEEVRAMLKQGSVDILMTGGDTVDKDYVTRRLAADTATPIILHPSLGLELTRAFEWLRGGGKYVIEELLEAELS